MHNRHICVKNGMNRIKAARVPCKHISSRWFVKNVAYFCFWAEVLWLLASIIWKDFRSYVFTHMNRSVLMAYAPITCNAYHSASAPVAARYFLQMHACNARVYVGPPPHMPRTPFWLILYVIILYLHNANVTMQSVSSSFAMVISNLTMDACNRKHTKW